MMIYCELFDLWTGIDSRLISTTSRVAELSHAPQSHTRVYELIGITRCDAVMLVVRQPKDVYGISEIHQ